MPWWPALRRPALASPPSALGKNADSFRSTESAHSRAEHSALSLENLAASSRIFLSLRQRQHRRTLVGLGDFFGGHRHPAVWNSLLPAALREFRNPPVMPRHFRPRGLDLALGRHHAAAPRMAARSRLPALSLGLLQRIDDDVSAGPGFPSHPLRAEAWDAWKRNIFEYDGLRYIGSFAPLFVHQYSQAWFDFRGKRDRYADYFQNSAIATDVHRRFCIELAKQFPDYSDDLWGITASDSDRGLRGMGRPAGHGTDRWNGRSQRRRRFASLSAATGDAGPAQHTELAIPRRGAPTDS